jgi:hypothetical protein
MDLQLRSLLWKEWQERRTQFFVCTFWMVGATLYCILIDRTHRFRDPAASFYKTAMLFGWLMPMFIAMRTSLGETTDRTRSFASALPISPERRGWIRLAAGAAVLVVPIVLGAILLSLFLAAGWGEQLPTQAPPGVLFGLPSDRPTPDAAAIVALVAYVTAVAVWSTTTLYLLLSLIGTTLRTEARLGFVAVVVVLLWILAMFLGYALFASRQPDSVLLVAPIMPGATILVAGGGAMYSDLVIWRPLPLSLLLNLSVQGGLATWFVHRYSRVLPGGTKRAQKAPPKVWWRSPVPLPTRSIAITWLTLRESVPMCGVGLLIACLMTLFPTIWQNDPFRHEPVLRRFADALPSSVWIVGFLWAAVVGAGSFAAETDARLGELWRTWPVPFRRFFTIKFIVGLLAVLLVLDGTTIAAGWDSPNWGTYEHASWPYIACIVPMHATTFAVAVAWTCLLRRPVLGGMLAVVSWMMTSLGLEWSPATQRFDPLMVYNNLAREARHGPIDFTSHGYPVVITAMGMVLLASMVIAGLALRRYDPKRQAD